MLSRALIPAMAALLVVPEPASAQQALSDILVKLVQADIHLGPPAPGFPSHDTHFQPGTNQQLAPFFFNQELITQLATFPIGSSSGGFSYTFDPSLGTFNRTTDSFGPFFAERALTIGRKKLAFGLNFQYSRYDSFESKNLQNGDLKFYLRHAPCCGGAFFEGDLVETDLKLKLSTSEAVLFANYGLSNRVDVGLVVPIVHVNMDATVNATILRLATPGLPIHAFPDGGTTATVADGGSATGIGDILVRGKYRFLSTSQGGLAAGLDVRLPTADSKNLLGTGAKQATLTLIGSTAYGGIAPHVNVGYTFSGHSDVATIPNEFNYRGGIEVPVKPTITLTGDLVGRSLINAGRLQQVNTTFNYMNVMGVQGSTTLPEFQAVSGTLSTVLAAVGGKFNVGGNLLISANLLIPLNSSGLRPKVTPVIGFDYVF